MNTQPSAFMIYNSFDNEHEGGKLAEFGKRLGGEVRMQTGIEFKIFQVDDVPWGEGTQARINETLDSVPLLIPIMTPGFFRDDACRGHAERFLERERRQGREDLVLPVYYVTTQIIDEEVQRGTDPLAQALYARQRVDWRPLRFEPLTSAVVGKELEQLASRMRDSFWRTIGATMVRSVPARLAVSRDPGIVSTAAGQTTLSNANATADLDALDRVVDAYQEGAYSTIGEAIAAASAGERILVRPGLYRESLVFDKPLVLIGDGPRRDIEVQSRDGSVLQILATMGRVANLTLRQVGAEGDWFGVDIGRGDVDLEDCDISSESLGCVVIRNGANPRVHNNRLHDAKTGIIVLRGGLGRLEDNEVIGNNVGVEINAGGGPILRRNRINRNGHHAVRVHNGGHGVIEDNDLTGNIRGSWDIATDSESSVKRSGNRE
jgi:parallel beta-helix repeat protein